MTARVQPTNQTPTPNKTRTGIPGMTNSHRATLGAVTQRVPSSLMARYATPRTRPTANRPIAGVYHRPSPDAPFHRDTEAR